MRKRKEINTLNYKRRLIYAFFVIVIVISVGSSLINYMSSRRLVENNTKEHANNVLVQLSNTNDLLLENTIQTLKGFANNGELELFAKYYDSKTYSEKSEVFNYLSTIVSLNNYFTACYVYYPEYETVIDVNTRTPIYEKISQNPAEQVICEIYDAYQEGRTEQRILYPIVKTGGDIEWYMVIPFLDLAQVGERAVLIVAVDSSYFFSGLGTVQMEENACVYIADTKGRWFAMQPEDELQDKIVEIQKNSENCDFVYEHEGEKWLGIYMVSAKSGWRYLYTVPMANIYNEALLLAGIALLSVLACCVIGIVLTWILTKKLYRPLEMLRGKVSSEEFDYDEETDVLMVLEKRMNNLLAQNEQLRVRVTENEKLVKNTFLYRLLSNNIDTNTSIYEKLTFYNIPFTSRMYYQLIVLSAEQMDSENSCYEERRMTELQIATFEQVVKSELSHLPEFYMEMVYMEDSYFAFIVGFVSEDLSANAATVMQKLLQEYADEYLETSMFWGFSEVEQGVSSLPRLYQQACKMLFKIKNGCRNDIAEAVIRFLDQNYTDPQLNMKVLADEIGFSISYISKMFKNSTGISIKEYITKQRIATACTLLSTTNKKVWEVGLAVGYEQQRSFIEIFKKYKGMTPSEYRKE